MNPAELHQLRRTREAYFDKLTDPSNGYSLSGVFPMPADLPALYRQLSLLKSCLDSFRPFDPAQAVKLQEVFDTEYTHHSNKIEGNTLTLLETDIVVNKGLTVAGRSMREHTEAINHQEAIGFIRDLADRSADLTPYNLKQIHAIILRGNDSANAGVFRRVPVAILNSQHTPPQPYMIDKLMEDMFVFYEANKVTMHPVELAAQMHEKLVTIHPFIDGNGRTSRLVMNLVLLRGGYPITVISGDAAPRAEYYRTLQAAQVSATRDNSEFQQFVGANVRTWLLRYLDMVSVDTTVEGKDKGAAFFEAIAPSLGTAS